MSILPATFKRYENEIIATVDRIRKRYRDDPAMFGGVAYAYAERVGEGLAEQHSRNIIRSVAAKHVNRAYAKVQEAAATKAPRLSRAPRLQVQL